MCECSKNASALPNQGCILCTRSGRSERSVLRLRFHLHQVYFLCSVENRSWCAEVIFTSVNLSARIRGTDFDSSPRKPERRYSWIKDHGIRRKVVLRLYWVSCNQRGGELYTIILVHLFSTSRVRIRDRCRHCGSRYRNWTVRHWKLHLRQLRPPYHPFSIFRPP